MVFIRTSSPEDSRAEEQGLSWTCPPHVDFASTRGLARGEPNPDTSERPLRFLWGDGVSRALDRAAEEEEKDDDDDDDDQDQLLRLQTSFSLDRLTDSLFMRSGAVRPLPHSASCPAHRWVGV